MSGAGEGVRRSAPRQPSALLESPCVVWFQLKGSVEIAPRVLIATQVQVGGASVSEGVGVVRFELLGLVKIAQRVVMATLSAYT